MRKLIITQCSDEDFWYSELVGFFVKFKIIDETEEDYIVEMKNDYCCYKLAVLKTDCLVIEK